MLESCIVIASLVGVLNTEPNTKVELYKADCNHDIVFFVNNKENDTVVEEVKVIKINKDLSYTFKKGVE